MGLEAGRLRHRITIQRRVNQQDAETGAITPVWLVFASDVPAEVAPLSVREFISASQFQSQISARITIRYLPGVLATMRVVHGATLYNIEGVLPDLDSGREYLTLVCSAGVNEG